MTDIVRSSISDAILAAAAILDPPEPPLGYGSDLSCVDDLDPEMREVSGSDVRSLAEALIRSIMTPRGSVPDAPDYGIDLRSYLHRPSTRTELLAIEGDIANEWGKDDRVSRSEVTIDVLEMGRVLRGRGRVYPADPSLEPFSLVFGVTDAGAAIEEIYG